MVLGIGNRATTNEKDTKTTATTPTTIKKPTDLFCLSIFLLYAKIVMRRDIFTITTSVIRP